jgi:hypothetical protein
MNAFSFLLVTAVLAQSSGSNSAFRDSAPIFRGRRPPAENRPALPLENRLNDRGLDGRAQDGRAYHEYQQRISDLFKQESQAADETERAASIREMCDLHGEILRDSRYATSPVLKEYRGRLWSRLMKIKTELKHDLARDAKANQAKLDEVHALETADRASVLAADTLAASLSLLDQTQGGPGSILAFGGGAVPNNGAALVALIERTINPSFWDTNGGPGSIVYYAPLQCLVVRATSEVHGQLGGALKNLRGAGK